MNYNVRFYILIGVVLVVVGGLYFLIHGKGSSETPAVAPSAKQSDENPRASMDAPEVTSTHRESRLTPTASRPSTPHETSISAKVGVYAISGQVVLQSDESPVEGADVTVYWTDKDAAIPVCDDKNLWKARTDANGFFRVEELPSAEYVVIAVKDSLSDVGEAYIGTNQTKDSVITLALNSTGTIAGWVLNPSREPVNGALIALHEGKHGQDNIYGRITQTRSGPDGRFALQFVEEGTWSIHAKAEGYTVAEVYNLAHDSSDVEVFLQIGASVSGTVVSAETSEPVPNVVLRFSPPGRRSNLKNEKITTNTDGTFRLTNVADGSYYVVLDKSPYILAGEVPPIVIENAKSIEDLRLNVVMGGSISGRATDAESGAPIAGMSFRADSAGRSSQPTATDTDGTFRIEGLRAGQYAVRRTRMAGYRHGEEREDKPASVTLGKETSGIDFIVPSGQYLRGRVVDTHGRPLLMVSVSGTDSKATEGDSAVTDEKGRWTLHGFSEGSVVTITAEKAGFAAPSIDDITVSGSDLDDIEIVLEVGASIEGTVVAKSGSPIEAAHVSAGLVNSSPRNRRYHAAQSKLGGTFKIRGLDEGSYYLFVTPPHSFIQKAPSHTEVNVRKGETVTGVKLVVDIELGSKIGGRVTDSSGKPIKDVTVQAFMQDGAGSEGSTQSGGDGNYEISGLPTGTYVLSVFHSNYTQLPQQKVDAPNSSFNITLRGKATIKGRIVDALSGSPIKSFSIVAISGLIDQISPGESWGQALTVVDEEGYFEIRADDGGATLLVKSLGYAPALTKIPDSREGQTKSGVEIRLKGGGAIEGTITTETGKRVAGARIYTDRMPMAWQLQQRQPAAATSDADGAFRLDSLPEEEIRLFVLHEEYATATAAAMPSSGGAPTKVQIVLSGGGSISGTVRVNGMPEAGYGISLRFPNGGYQNDTEVGTNGEYTFTGLPDGVATLSLHALRSGTQRRNISRQATVVAGQIVTIDFDLAGGTAVLEGTVTRGGQPFSRASIELLIGPNADSREQTGAQTDANGTFRFENLPPGSAAVMVRAIDAANNQRIRSFRVELENDRTTRLDASLDGDASVGGRVTGVPQGWHAEIGLVLGTVEIPVGATIDEAFMPLMGRIAGGGRVSAAGSFQIEGLDAGEFTLVIVAMDPESEGQTFKYATAPVTVTENGETSVDVTIP